VERRRPRREAVNGVQCRHIDHRREVVGGDQSVIPGHIDERSCGVLLTLCGAVPLCLEAVV
jgi:hypothetical protein